MAAPRKESFFSSPSNTFKRLVNAFPKSQKHAPPRHPQSSLPREHRQLQPRLAVQCQDEDTCDDDSAVVDADVIDCSDGECVHVPTSSAAEDVEMEADIGAEDQTDYSSGEDEYPRPRIRPDLLPYDFPAWQKSPSIASSTSRDAETFSEVLSSSTSQERYASHGVAVSQTRTPRTSNYGEDLSDCNLMENFRRASPKESPAASSPLVDLYLHKMRQDLPDLKLDVVADGTAGSCKFGGPGALPCLPDNCRSMHSVASEDGRCSSVDGSCQQRRNVRDTSLTVSRVRDLMQEGTTMHQNLGDLAPFIESFRENWDDSNHRNTFQHHASMVYTRAPSRDTLMKKVADVANAKKPSRIPKKLKKKSEAAWEDQENHQQRRGSDVSCTPRRASYENAVDIAKLQGQVEQLQRKLSVTEGVLQSYHCVLTPKKEGSEILLLEKKVVELQRHMSEKDRLLESAENTLVLKENEIQALQRYMSEAEEMHSAARARSADMEEEVISLRCEVAALRWQIEIEAEKMRSEIKELEDSKETKDFLVGRQGEEQEHGKIEVARKMYLTALVVARICPREECFALVSIMRTKLHELARIRNSELAFIS